MTQPTGQGLMQRTGDVRPDPMQGRDYSRLIQWAVAAVLVVIVAGPLIPILLQGVLSAPLYSAENSFSLGNFTRLFAASGVGTMVWNTVAFALIATVIAQVVGASMAILIGRTNLPGRAWMGEIVIWPIFVGHLVIAFGWVTMYGPSGYISMFVRSLTGVQPWDLYTLTGMGVVGGLTLAPMAYLFCIGAVMKIDGQLEDAARSVGASPFRAMLGVTLPMMRPALVYSTMTNLVIAIEMLSIPLLFGAPVNISTITTFIYQNGLKAVGQPDYGLVGAASVMLLAVVLVLIWAQAGLMRNAARFVSVKGKASRVTRLDLGRARWPLAMLLGGYIFFFIILVFLGVILRAFVSFLSPFVPIGSALTLSNFQQIFDSESHVRAILNSLTISAVGGAVGVAFALLVVVVAMRSEFRYRRALHSIALLPRAVPGIVAGLGIFYMLIWLPGFSILRGTIWIIALAYIMRYVSLAFSSIAPAVTQIGDELDRGARISGASWWRTMRDVVFPLVKPAAFAAYCLLFIQFFKDYVTASFVTQAGSEVIGTSMLGLWNNGENGAVSALATIQIAVTITFIIFARRIMGVKIYG